MSLIVSRASLHSNVADWLLRDDLEDQIPTFVQLAEARLKRDTRVQRLVTDTLEVTGGEVALPARVREIENLRHQSPYQNVALRAGTLATVTQARARNSEGALPEVYAVGDEQIWFGPTPDQDYTLDFSYWEGIESLSASVLSNWLLASHPDIYLYSTLIESAPYLRDDPRLETWTAMREEALEGLRRANERKHYGGALSRFPTHPIG